MIEETTWLFLAATGALVAYALFAFGFYRVLHVPVPGRSWVARSAQRRGLDEVARRRADTWWRAVGVPALVCSFGVVLAVLDVGIIADREVEDIYAISAGVIAAVRILAFVWDEPAGELAKMVPIAVLSVAVFNSSAIDLEAWGDGLAEAGSENAWVYVVVLVVLEWLLQFAVGPVLAHRGRGVATG